MPPYFRSILDIITNQFDIIYTQISLLEMFYGHRYFEHYYAKATYLKSRCKCRPWVDSSKTYFFPRNFENT